MQDPLDVRYGARRPRWYIPRGMRVPDHLPPGVSRMELTPGHGPDGHADDPETGGGLVVGGRWEPEEEDLARWRQTPAGYWIDFAGATPQILLRVDAVPGAQVEGSVPGHYWIVPQLLEVAPGGGWRTAMDMVLTVDGWQLPERYRGISERVKDVVDNWSEYEQAENGLDRLAEVVVAALEINYYTCMQDLQVYEWITSEVMPRVLRALVTGEGSRMGEARLEQISGDGADHGDDGDDADDAE